VPTVNVFEAKTNLSKLVAQAERGEEIIIARAGKPVARLTQIKPDKPKIRFGGLKGKIWVAEDFDAPLPDDLLDEFENGPIFPPEHPGVNLEQGSSKSAEPPENGSVPAVG
jgi:prevent-host-death family protein